MDNIVKRQGRTYEVVKHVSNEVKQHSDVRLYAVMSDNGGAHEPDNMLSIWTTEDLAKNEAIRLKSKCEYGSKCFGYTELVLNRESEEYPIDINTYV